MDTSMTRCSMLRQTFKALLQKNHSDRRKMTSQPGFYPGVAWGNFHPVGPVIPKCNEATYRKQCFCLLITPPPVGTGSGVLFSLNFFLSFFLSFFVCMYVSLFLCQQDYEKTAGPISMKFSGKAWSDHGTT